MSTRALRKLEQSEASKDTTDEADIEVGQAESDLEADSAVNRFSLLVSITVCL